MRSLTLTPSYFRHWNLLPIAAADSVRVLACDVPDPQALDDIRWVYGLDPIVELIAPEALQDAILHAESEHERTAADFVASLEASAPSESDAAMNDGDLLAKVQEAPVVRLVNLLLIEALDASASDVHLEAGRQRVDVRYRIDGVLVNAPSPPAALVSAVIGRLKVMAELDVAERRRPQDGRIRLQAEGRSVDVRVSTLPTLHGESVVLRLLESDGKRLGMGELGMAADTRSTLESLLTTPHGVLLTTGPTGSGKTTTLYAALEHISSGREKIVTVEDPIEYALNGIAQVPVNRKAGVTFASALRSILRQDPDVILVGEMRDTETAEICVQAALTGHLVLSTLHTNDATAAVVRLLDLEIEPYLVTSTVEGVLAQRLVRVVCRECGEYEAPTPFVVTEFERFGWHADRIRRGRGCTACRHTGFRGRTGIYELLVITDDIRTEVLRGRGSSALRDLAISSGMRPLRSDGWRQVAAGITTPEEVLRVTR